MGKDLLMALDYENGLLLKKQFIECVLDYNSSIMMSSVL